MGGKFSRNKGRREEQQLVLALSKLGYKAERILRQYQQAGQADVKTLAPEQYTFELKSRRASFKTIYDLYYSERDPDGVLPFFIGRTPIAISTDFKELLKTDRHFREIKPDDAKIRVYKRILSMVLWKQTADYLVLRDNGKPRLFVRYW